MSNARLRNRYFDTLFSNHDLMWMGQNTNHIPTHPVVKAAMLKSIEREEYSAYAPPWGLEALRDAVVDDLGVPGMEALITEGGVNALSLICRARCAPGKTFVTTDPTWKWPCQFAEQQGAEIVQLPIYGDEYDNRLSVEHLSEACDERTALIYIVDPNNPLGCRYSREELVGFIDVARRYGALLIHDCTYRDFADDHTLAISINSEHAVVSMSFSKWLGLAGLRVGALVGNPKLIDEFAAQSTSVLGGSVIAQRAALAGLSVKKEWMTEVRRIDRANKQRIRDAVDSIPGLRVLVWPSHGNFLVIETASADISPAALVDLFSREGIMIRQGSYHTEQFGDHFIKVSTSVPEDWARCFCEHLPLLVEQAHGIKNIEAQF
ncbi:pyridoxal phosphate-dependent aminotransferase [Halomonas sp. QX-2]|jgi:aspartate/methionine/tyrosine aminotransferase|uniref:Aminotransferase n=1 Tax=Vreelandella sedimenti TaxID=2729618 RepID=A0A7Z0N6I6_9GAMM|nr:MULTISPECIES: pyridoxal phosphate-dependent aminotransferase [Halomonas]NYT71896.1 pyridoxal phosphate-dependent aminotransferase [Halomonas sedimenti]|tara:strand:- start:129006 stop:130139 length:1134 start_codon:yes stop_codon:yes gene_type:complete